MANSNFKTTGFDWQYTNPNRSVESYIVILSGPTVVYSQADVDTLFTYRCPVNIRATGDPANGGRVYVDHFGPDPSGPLQLFQLQPDGTLVHKQFSAILREIKRTQALPRGVHFCDMEFVLMDAGVVI